jgi:hypothetical protein
MMQHYENWLPGRPGLLVGQESRLDSPVFPERSRRGRSLSCRVSFGVDREPIVPCRAIHTRRDLYPLLGLQRDAFGTNPTHASVRQLGHGP